MVFRVMVFLVFRVRVFWMAHQLFWMDHQLFRMASSTSA